MACPLYSGTVTEGFVERLTGRFGGHGDANLLFCGGLIGNDLEAVSHGHEVGGTWSLRARRLDAWTSPVPLCRMDESFSRPSVLRFCPFAVEGINFGEFSEAVLVFAVSTLQQLSTFGGAQPKLMCEQVSEAGLV